MNLLFGSESIPWIDMISFVMIIRENRPNERIWNPRTEQAAKFLAEQLPFIMID